MVATDEHALAEVDAPPDREWRPLRGLAVRDDVGPKVGELRRSDPEPPYELLVDAFGQVGSQRLAARGRGCDQHPPRWRV